MIYFKLLLIKYILIGSPWGKPIIILACSTCYYIFENYIPDIEIISLWKIFNEKGLPNITDNGRGKSLVVHDSCTARDYSHIYDSIRDIACKLEYELIEPELTKKETQCCGYGGLAYFANREFSTYATDQRVQEKMESIWPIVLCVGIYLCLGGGKGLFIF